jgi:hypothetical protein
MSSDTPKVPPISRNGHALTISRAASIESAVMMVKPDIVLAPPLEIAPSAATVCILLSGFAGLTAASPSVDNQLLVFREVLRTFFGSGRLIAPKIGNYELRRLLYPFLVIAPPIKKSATETCDARHARHRGHNCTSATASPIQQLYFPIMQEAFFIKQRKIQGIWQSYVLLTGASPCAGVERPMNLRDKNQY